MGEKGKDNTQQSRQDVFLPLSVFAVFCLLTGVVIWFETLSPDNSLRPLLAVLAGALVMAFLLLLSFWLARSSSRPAHAAAVVLWVLYILILLAMAFQVYQDIRNGLMSRDTWLTAGVLTAGVLGIFGRKILAAFRRKAFRNRTNHVVMGRIYQIMGETHLDLDGDPVTLCHALIDYAVEDKVYETRADISRSMIRKFGRDAFLGRPVSVFYNPLDPASAYTERIDRHFFDE